MHLDEKEATLSSMLQGFGSVAIAFSGGVDSSYLCAVAEKVLGNKAVAFTIDSPLVPRSEMSDAGNIASLIGIRHVILKESTLTSIVSDNPPDRCYHCKRLTMATIVKAAATEGFDIVAEGSNLDDLGDYRPGRRASLELGIHTPLADASLSKSEIRELSRRRNLPTWDKPSFACLASRVPYGESLDTETLARIEAAEVYLQAQGFKQMRVRVHGNIARIEVAHDERSMFFDEARLDAISSNFKRLGFTYVCMELEGYTMGSLNKSLNTEGMTQ